MSMSRQVAGTDAVGPRDAVFSADGTVLVDPNQEDRDVVELGRRSISRSTIQRPLRQRCGGQRVAEVDISIGRSTARLARLDVFDRQACGIGAGASTTAREDSSVISDRWAAKALSMKAS